MAGCSPLDAPPVLTKPPMKSGFASATVALEDESNRLV
jgi:hypothetical protein